MTRSTPEIAQAARVLSSSGTALTLLQDLYDEGRQLGLQPHHAINRALGKLAAWPGPAGTGGVDEKRS